MPAATLRRMTEQPDVVSVERVIPALAERIFALVADPSQHRAIDGSGTVRDAKATPGGQLRLGSKFGMNMKAGIPYSMVNTVIEFEPDRRIAWQTAPPGVLAHLFGGRIWRYELEPADGGTRVRESWDFSREKVKAFVRPAAKHTRANMERTLERIEQIVTG
jgi:uncharacterized protein YndB with AHSA1/START domain